MIKITTKAIKHLIHNILGLSLILALFTFYSCGSDSDDAVPERTYSNTVFVYMPWAGVANSKSGNTLLSFFHQNIRDIESAIKSGNGNTDTRTIVLLSDSASGSRLFEINDDGTETTLANYTTGVRTSAEEIKSLLNTVAEYFPTPTYSIIVGAHGSGWLPAGSAPQNARRAFGGVGRATQTEISTLADAIVQSNIGKMQYVCFDDCYMANIETVYALRNATHWLVGSTSEVMQAGLPYASIWKYMSATNVDYSGIVTGFGDFYSHYSSPYGALSAIDCSKADRMATLMKAFNAKYASQDYNLSDIQALDGYESHVFYDMGDYINNVCENDTADNRELYKELEDIVPYKFTTPSLYTEFGFQSFIVRAFSGIAISDPSRNSVATASKEATEWWKATH